MIRFPATMIGKGLKQLDVRNNPRTILDGAIGSGGENKKKKLFIYGSNI
jgi:hypothetical protein